MTQLVHADKPLVHQPEHQLGAAAPTVRVAMLNLLRLEQHALLAQVVGDRSGHLADVHAGQPVKPIYIDAIFVKWGYCRQPELLPEEKIFFAAAGGDVDDASTLLL